MSIQKTVTKTVKGIPLVRAAQRRAIAAKADLNNLATEVLLRVPVIEVGNEDHTVSFPKYYEELIGRHWEHYNVHPISKDKFEGIWCELIISKEIAESIIQNHSDAKIISEQEDGVV